MGSGATGAHFRRLSDQDGRLEDGKCRNVSRPRRLAVVPRTGIHAAGWRGRHGRVRAANRAFRGFLVFGGRREGSSATEAHWNGSSDQTGQLADGGYRNGWKPRRFASVPGTGIHAAARRGPPRAVAQRPARSGGFWCRGRPDGFERRRRRIEAGRAIKTAGRQRRERHGRLLRQGNEQREATAISICSSQAHPRCRVARSPRAARAANRAFRRFVVFGVVRASSSATEVHW